MNDIRIIPTLVILPRKDLKADAEKILSTDKIKAILIEDGVDFYCPRYKVEYKENDLS